MKKIIINILKVISWILIYVLNFCIMIKFEEGPKYIMPLLSLLSGPILFLLWRFYAERENRYINKERILIRKFQLKKLRKQGYNETSMQALEELNKQELTKSIVKEQTVVNKKDPIKSDYEDIKAFNIPSLCFSTEEESKKVNKDSSDSIRREVLKELKGTPTSTITLKPDNYVRNIILLLLSLIMFVVSYIIFTRYKVQILAKVSSFSLNALF